MAVAVAAPAVVLDSAPSFTEPLAASVAAPSAALAFAQAESKGVTDVDDLSLLEVFGLRDKKTGCGAEALRQQGETDRRQRYCHVLFRKANIAVRQNKGRCSAALRGKRARSSLRAHLMGAC